MNKILLFAQLKEQAGSNTLALDVSGKTVKELRDYLESETDLGSLTGIMIAINEEFATDETIINAEDVIALIPPVSGG
ncbi:molybdopterin converting factor subunit 1 [Lederbergia wuyishanensis]|uniref:Molybdopterin synthase sulfur carrier subunit n=1 Tax=Lederbergia wuyishanensis TaxID=1347903 RepID=A0ABU0D3L4_9BACI|nr:molybdopterin converting factor subunit 1 [Lederbergia wuyishanensis]MCJ8007857.1 molybdopterin converting factor subunit 1 [Lederbergia wuyishanensis]MDQ0342975.1 molybdopterin synthase sulfur carrier subunit [Lederbergia wuyishanensis]